MIEIICKGVTIQGTTVADCLIKALKIKDSDEGYPRDNLRPAEAEPRPKTK
jgi:hypothetical protein